MTSEDNIGNKLTRPRSSKACLECRAMKSRCQGQHPCERCVKRGVECIYEDKVRRRGPDRKPRAVSRRKDGSSGSLRRVDDTPSICKRSKPPLPSISTSSSSGNEFEPSWLLNSNNISSTTSSPILSYDSTRNMVDFNNKSKSTNQFNFTEFNTDILFMQQNHSNQFINNFNRNLNVHLPLNTQSYSHPPPTSQPMLIQPNLNYHQDSYWDVLISERIDHNNIKDRNQALKSIINDLWLVFSRCDFVATMFYLPTFFDVILNHQKRNRIESALIYALLSLSFILQGKSNNVNSNQYHVKSVYMSDKSHGILESAIATNKYTIGIAQAAIVLTYYEFFPKPIFNIKRAVMALLVSDNIIRALALTCLDADKVEHVYDDDGVPVITQDNTNVVSPNKSRSSSLEIEEIRSKPMCPCVSWSQSADLTRKEGIRFRIIPKFAVDESSETEIQQEEIRRLVWATLDQAWFLQMLEPSIMSSSQQLHVHDSSNYGIYLTGERFTLSILDEECHTWSRRTLWAYLDRLRLLSHAAMRLKRHIPPLELNIRAMKINSEIDKIEKDLENFHSCQDSIHGWYVSNVAFITKMIITARMRSCVKSFGPSTYFTRQRAREWLDSHGYIYSQVIILLLIVILISNSSFS